MSVSITQAPSPGRRLQQHAQKHAHKQLPKHQAGALSVSTAFAVLPIDAFRALRQANRAHRKLLCAFHSALHVPSKSHPPGAACACTHALGRAVSAQHAACIVPDLGTAQQPQSAHALLYLFRCTGASAHVGACRVMCLPPRQRRLQCWVAA